uniref:Uncharacterized protein n=1 Tax=Steinernema glaseri TaxID=37863 RepID=A0A1I7ZC22_9BILA
MRPHGGNYRNAPHESVRPAVKRVNRIRTQSDTFCLMWKLKQQLIGAVAWPPGRPILLPLEYVPILWDSALGLPLTPSLIIVAVCPHTEKMSNNLNNREDNSSPLEFTAIQIDAHTPTSMTFNPRNFELGARRQQRENAEPVCELAVPKNRRGRSVDQRRERYRMNTFDYIPSSTEEHSLPPLAPLAPPQSKMSTMAESIFSFTERVRTVVAYRKRNSQESIRTISNQPSFDAVPWEECPSEPKKCEKVPMLKNLKTRSSSEAKLYGLQVK